MACFGVARVITLVKTADHVIPGQYTRLPELHAKSLVGLEVAGTEH